MSQNKIVDLFPGKLKNKTRDEQQDLSAEEIRFVPLSRGFKFYVDFDTLCEQNEITETEIQRRYENVLLKKRLCWLCGFTLVLLASMAMASLCIYGFRGLNVQGSLCLILLAPGLPVAGVCAAFVFKFALFSWQLETRKLGSAAEFVRVGGLGRMIRF